MIAAKLSACAPLGQAVTIQNSATAPVMKTRNALTIAGSQSGTRKRAPARRRRLPRRIAQQGEAVQRRGEAKHGVGGVVGQQLLRWRPGRRASAPAPPPASLRKRDGSRSSHCGAVPVAPGQF